MAPLIDAGKRNLLGVLVDAVDYEGATARLIDAARGGRPLAATALAAHGVVIAARDPELRHRVNRFGLVAPDGQAVRWALNLLHGTALADRVAGPHLTVEVCRAAAQAGVPVFLYGSRPEVLARLVPRLQAAVAGLQVAGAAPSRFRPATAAEADATCRRIRASGAGLTLVGLGCPRQEVFAFENADALGMPTLAVGAAFDFHAGLLPRAPEWVQRAGLEWAYRLGHEPRRLWRRYATTNPAFLAGVVLQASGVWRPDPASTTPPPRPLLHA